MYVKPTYSDQKQGAGDQSWSVWRKKLVQAYGDETADKRDHWIKKNRFYYEQDYRYMRFLVPEGLRILDLGCGTGELLARLKPSYGLGIDISANMVEVARSKFPDLDFIVADIESEEFSKLVIGQFDVVIMSDTIGYLSDCEAALDNLRNVCKADTRLIISYYSRMWEPILSLAEKLRLKSSQPPLNWLSTSDIENFAMLSDFEVIKRDWRQLVPRRLFGIGSFINKYIAPLAVIRRACLRNYIVARPLKTPALDAAPSVSIVIPCRNEKGNIEAAVRRIPPFSDDIEIIFVEGNSKDGTLEEIRRVMAAYPEQDIKVFVQDGKGKGDAVRKGFAHARGDILMILDADLTTPPEDLPKFYRALSCGKGEFINGTRLVYPMEKDAMRFLNFLANQVFSWLFSWLLNQRFTDTLCGTKVLYQRHYEKIVRNRGYFGDFDPFGDFDLIFGAAKLNLRVVEIPVSYASRRYGETQISRFRHGMLLIRMVIFAYRKLKTI